MKKMSSILLLILPVGLILVLAFLAATPSTTSVQAQMMGTATSTPATIQVATNAKLGPILVDSKGMTVYRFSIDTPGVSKCSGACLTAWPAVTVPSGTQVTAGPGVTGKVGTFTRSDGTVQVTINNLPLYYFSKDKAPGDVTGEAISAFGGTWHVVNPAGVIASVGSSNPSR